MGDRETIPLFVLPSGIFPSINESLRVFEPRYKQMLDDCTLDDIQFGYIAHDSDSDDDSDDGGKGLQFDSLLPHLLLLSFNLPASNSQSKSAPDKTRDLHSLHESMVSWRAFLTGYRKGSDRTLLGHIQLVSFLGQ